MMMMMMIMMMDEFPLASPNKTTFLKSAAISPELHESDMKLRFVILGLLGTNIAVTIDCDQGVRRFNR